MIVSLVRPHFPLTAPPEFFSLYDPEKMTMPRLYDAAGRPTHPAVKGVRTAADFDYEAQMAQFNGRLADEVETVFLPASPEWAFLSSSGVREAAAWGADVRGWVPAHVAEALLDRIGPTA